MEMLVTALTQVLAPKSLSLAGNDDGRRTKAVHSDVWREVVGSPWCAGQPMPGDIVLIATGGSVYGLGRMITGQRFDHALVVMECQRLLHISPPVVRSLPFEAVLLDSRQPLVLRPKWANDGERQQFLQDLKSLIGQAYPVIGFIQTFSNLTLKNFSNNNLGGVLAKQSTQRKGQSPICTEAIVSALVRNCSNLNEALSRHGTPRFLDFYGGFQNASLEDLVKLTKLFPSALCSIECIAVKDLDVKAGKAGEMDGLRSSWSQTLGESNYVFIRDDRDVSTLGSNKDETFSFSSLRRFGPVGEAIDMLQKAFEWIISKQDQRLLNQLCSRVVNTVTEYLGKLQIVDAKWIEEMQPIFAVAGYTSLFLILLRKGKQVAMIIFQAIRLALLRRVLLLAWEEVTRTTPPRAKL